MAPGENELDTPVLDPLNLLCAHELILLLCIWVPLPQAYNLLLALRNKGKCYTL